MQRKLPTLLLSLATWTTVTLLVGCTFALSGIAGIYAAIVLASLVVFGAVAAKCPAGVMAAAIWCLGLFPFSWGLQTGVLPKLFGDESLLLLYLAVFPFLYLFTMRSWLHGFSALYVVLAVFLCTQALSFATARTDLVASRNFLETYVLGVLLLVLFLQEVSNANPETIGTSVFWITVFIATLSVVEAIVQRNPIMERSTDIPYLSPELARITEGVYRPYVSFFHPSEAGTFMALGVPFVLRGCVYRKAWLSSIALAVVTAGLIINATRGVWFGVAIASLFLIPNARVILSAIIPIGAITGVISYLAFKTSPFMQRLTDLNNLYSRLESWKVAVKIFIAHPLIGVGHMQFKEVYLDYVQNLSNLAHFDIGKIFVADNMYLTTTVEHGSLGLFTLLGLFVFAAALLRKSRMRLLASGLTTEASFVRCSELALVIYAATGCFADLNQFTKATKYVFILVGLGLGAGGRYVRSMHSATKVVADKDTLMRVHGL